MTIGLANANASDMGSIKPFRFIMHFTTDCWNTQEAKFLVNRITQQLRLSDPRPRAIWLLIDILAKTRYQFDINDEMIDLFIDCEHIYEYVAETHLEPYDPCPALGIKNIYFDVRDCLEVFITEAYKEWVFVLKSIPFRGSCYAEHVELAPNFAGAYVTFIVHSWPTAHDLNAPIRSAAIGEFTSI